MVVTGISLITALGKSRTSTWENLLQGRCGIRNSDYFPQHPNVLLGLVSDSPQDFRSLILKSIQEALHDAQLPHPPHHTGIVLGSSRGNQGDIEAIARKDANLKQWLAAYSASPSHLAAEYLKCEGPILAPRAACATGLWAIAQGAELIREGLAHIVIAGGIETPITPLTIAGFQKMGALSNSGSAPFDINRSGFVLGEGAAVLILESQQHAAQRQQASYGEILGFGASADGYHMSAPNPDPHTGLQAVLQCLERSQTSPETIEFIHAHGTGTKLNDQNEAKIIQQLFPQAPFTMSSKGATGHTLGASGAIGTALCLLSLKHEVLPATVGLQNIDPSLGINVLRKPHYGKINRALCLSFGFGGQNAALILGRSPAE